MWIYGNRKAPTCRGGPQKGEVAQTENSPPGCGPGCALPPLALLLSGRLARTKAPSSGR